MRERPILFSGRLVRWILDGRKTQTRRVIRPEWWRCLDPDDPIDRARAVTQCPFGQQGDQLWVRETWARIWWDICDCHDDDNPDRIRTVELCQHEYIDYRASCEDDDRFPGHWPSDAGDDPACPRWRPSIHMPRAFSRIDLEVTGVRIEPLQLITESDAKAEGVAAVPARGIVNGIDLTAEPHRARFSLLWNEINEARGFGWGDNPWVWVVSFRRMRP